MRCVSCGSSFVMANAERCACAGHTNGRIRNVNLTVRREVMEDRVLSTVRESLLSDESIRAFTSRLRRRLRERPVDPSVKRRKELEAEVANLVDAIGKGLLSPTLAKRLQAAEAELAALPAPSRDPRR